MEVSGRSPAPILIPLVRSTSAGTNQSAESPTQTTTLPARQRCPVFPKADPKIPSTAAPRLASGMMIEKFFAPHMHWTRLPCAAPFA